MRIFNLYGNKVSQITDCHNRGSKVTPLVIKSGITRSITNVLGH